MQTIFCSFPSECNKINRLNAYLNKSKMCEQSNETDSTGWEWINRKFSSHLKRTAMCMRFIKTHSIKWLKCLLVLRVSKFLLISSENRKVVCVCVAVEDTLIIFLNQNIYMQWDFYEQQQLTLNVVKIGRSS